MSNTNEVAGYGYIDDEEQVGGGSNLSFGLNAGTCFMTKFEGINNAGKDGAEGIALEIIFTINGTPKSYRLFPVTKAFIDKKDGGGETEDPRHPAMKEAFKDFNAIMTHILHCFVPREDIVTAFGVPISSFQQYCNIAKGLLPTNYAQIPLDIFLEYQWQVNGENTITFLQIPKKMKHGKWLCKAIPPVDGEWTEIRKEDPKDNDNTALIYKDGANNVHPITRNGWYVKSNFANQQREDKEQEENAINAIPAATPPPATGGSAPAATGW